MSRLTAIIRGGLRRIGGTIHRLGTPPAATPNLTGDRELEWSWVAARIGRGPGALLDFGCGPESVLGLTAARLGYQVTAIDLRPIRWSHHYPGLRFMQQDLLRPRFEPSNFDVIINCSTIEHVGLSGRYGSADRPDGDLEAMAVLRRLLKPAGFMVMTIPVGRDAVFAPFHRIYGTGRLPLLLKEWRIDCGEFWIKNGDNRWVQTNEARALNEAGSAAYYGLGLFVLRRGPDGPPLS